MKLVLVKEPTLLEDRTEIHFREHTTLIDEVITLIQGNKPQLVGIYNEEKHPLLLEDIFYFEAVEKRCFVYLEKKVYEVRYTLQELEALLDDYGFIRISKSSIVNIYKITKIKCLPNMRIVVALENHETLVISRRYKKEFERYLKKRREMI